MLSTASACKLEPGVKPELGADPRLRSDPSRGAHAQPGVGAVRVSGRTSRAVG